MKKTFTKQFEWVMGMTGSTSCFSPTRRLLLLLCLILVGVGGAKAQSDVEFNDYIRYSQWVIDSRLGDFYGNQKKFGFTTYDRNLKAKNTVSTWYKEDGSTYNIQVDYVAGLVAKATIEAAEYYQNFDWSKPWFKSVEWYGNKCTVPTEPNNLDAINASKMYFGIYNLANGAFKNDAGTTDDEQKTDAYAQTQLGKALTALKNYNKEYKSDGTGGYAFPANTTVTLGDNSISLDGGWFHKNSYLNEMWLDGQYMGPATLAQLIKGYPSYTAISDNDWKLITKQFSIVWNMCWDDTEELLYHAFCSEPRSNTWADEADIWKTAQTNKSSWKGMSAAGHSAAFWGRAEGWYFLALVDVLEQMQIAGLDSESDPNHSCYTTLKGYLDKLALGIAKRQDATSGCWYQLIGKDGNYSAQYYNGDDKGVTKNYLESSCTAIFTAAYLKAIRLGLLEKDTYFSTAEKAYKGMVKQFMKKRTDGTVDLLGCCKSAGVGTAALGNQKFRDGSNAYYLHGYDVTPTSTNSGDYYTEGKVLGAFILAATEYEREYQPSMLLSKDLNETYNLSSNESLTVEVLGDGTATYQWYNANTSTAIEGATNASYTPTKSGKYYCKITVTPTSAGAKTIAASTSGSYTIKTSTADVTVAAAATTYTVTFNAGSNGTCSTESPTQVSAGANITLPSVTANTGYTFDGWYTAETGGTKVDSPYTPTEDVTLYAHYTETSSGGGTGGSVTGEVVYFDTKNSNVSTNTSVVNASGTGTTTGSVTYNGTTYTNGVKLQSSKVVSLTLASSCNVILVFRTTDATKTVTVGTNTYTVGSDGTITISELAAGTYEIKKSSGESHLYAVDIQPTGPSISFTTQPSNKACAQGVSVSLTVAAAVNNDTGSEYGDVTYQWYSNTTESNQNGKLLEGKTEATLTPSTSEQGTKYYYCVATAAKTSDANQKLTATSNVVAVTVSAPTITITTQPTDATFAVGTTEGSISVVASANNEKECTYQWYKCDDTSKTNPSPILVAKQASYSPDKATAGTYYYYCVVKADDCADVTSDVATVTIKKLAIVLEYLYNGASSLTWNAETKTKPADFKPELKGYVANEDGTKSSTEVNLSTLKIVFKSDVEDVATVTEYGTIHILDNANGGAKIYAMFEGKNSDGTTDNTSYEKAQTFFNVIATQGYSYSVADEFTSSTRPALNSSVYIKKGTTNLVKMTFGGWKWNVTSNGEQSTYSVNGSNRTDVWSCLDSQRESEIASIDGYSRYIVGATDAVDEAKAASEGNIYGSIRYGWFKPAQKNAEGYLETYPYSLPVRGAYMTFEPTQNGTLTVYILQNGAWNTNRSGSYNGISFKDGDIVAGEFRPHSFYICNQRGLNVDQFSPNTFKVTTKQSVQGKYYCDRTSEDKQSDPYNIATWTEFKDYMSLAEQDSVAKNWSSGINGAQKIVKLGNGSYLAIQKGIVKYTFFVTANETYYMFSNFSKLGFCGANFVPSKTVVPGDDDAHKMTLSDETAYPKITKVSDDTDEDKNKYAWKFGDDIKGYVSGFTIPLFKAITLNRKFTADQWTTLTLPFNLTQTEVQEIFGSGTQLIQLNNATVDNGCAKLEFVYHEIQNVLPGYPYLIKPTLVGADGTAMTSVETSADNAPTYTIDGGKLTGFTVYDKAINPNINQFEIPCRAYTFKGVPGYSTAALTSTSGKNGYSVKFEENDIFVSDGDGKMYVSAGSSHGKGYRAWFKKKEDTTSGGKINSISLVIDNPGDDDDNVVTTIDMVDVDPDVFNALGIATGVYNLNGQKVSDDMRSLPKGIYIVNGKKIVRK